MGRIPTGRIPDVGEIVACDEYVRPADDGPGSLKLCVDCSAPASYHRARAKPAASELIAALERCLSALAANGAPNCEAAKEARAAIAKATGEVRHG